MLHWQNFVITLSSILLHLCFLWTFFDQHRPPPCLYLCNFLHNYSGSARFILELSTNQTRPDQTEVISPLQRYALSVTRSLPPSWSLSCFDLPFNFCHFFTFCLFRINTHSSKGQFLSLQLHQDDLGLTSAALGTSPITTTTILSINVQFLLPSTQCPNCSAL